MSEVTGTETPEEDKSKGKKKPNRRENLTDAIFPGLGTGAAVDASTGFEFLESVGTFIGARFLSDQAILGQATDRFQSLTENAADPISALTENGGELALDIASGVVGLFALRHGLHSFMALIDGETNKNQKAFAVAALGASAAVAALAFLPFLAPAMVIANPVLAAATTGVSGALIKLGGLLVAGALTKRARNPELAEKSAKGWGGVLPFVSLHQGQLKH